MPAIATTVDIVFTEGLGPMSGQFVGIQDFQGKEISLGEWIERDDGRRVLRIRDPRDLEVARKAMEPLVAYIKNPSQPIAAVIRREEWNALVRIYLRLSPSEER